MSSERKRMIALVDCESFYASCERVFDPSLYGRPVVLACVRLDTVWLVSSGFASLVLSSCP